MSPTMDPPWSEQHLLRDLHSVATPNTLQPFTSKQDVFNRLMPYHAFSSGGDHAPAEGRYAPASLLRAAEPAERARKRMKVLEGMLEKEGKASRLKKASEGCFIESFQIQQEQIHGAAASAAAFKAATAQRMAPLPSSAPLVPPPQFSGPAVGHPAMSQASQALAPVSSGTAMSVPMTSQPSTFRPSWLQMQAAVHAKPAQAASVETQGNWVEVKPPVQSAAKPEPATGGWTEVPAQASGPTPTPQASATFPQDPSKSTIPPSTSASEPPAVTSGAAVAQGWTAVETPSEAVQKPHQVPGGAAEGSGGAVGDSEGGWQEAPPVAPAQPSVEKSTDSNLRGGEVGSTDRGADAANPVPAEGGWVTVEPGHEAKNS